jgi:plastocyanin
MFHFTQLPHHSRRFRRLSVLTLLALLLPAVLSACQPIQAPAVAPEVDRVGFPTDYQNAYQLFYELDRPDNKTARVIYANPAAASVQPGQPYPYGSVLVMEVHRTLKDEASNVLLDENGRYQRDALAGIFVMRKEVGYGAKYGDFRNGEWEYVAYRADGSFATSPERTNGCASCHVEAGQGRDWVFGTDRHFGVEAPAVTENMIHMDDYAFATPTLTVTVGTTVTWASHDVVMHTVTAKDFSFGSGALRPQGSFRHVFKEAGIYEYLCAIHPTMQGTVVVTEK